MRWHQYMAGILGCLLGLLFLPPLVSLIANGLHAGLPVLTTIGINHIATLVLKTASLAVLATAWATILALPFAWLVVRTNIPWRSLWRWLGTIPLAIPSYIGALTYITCVLVLKLLGRIELQGWTTVVFLVSWFGGMILMSLGVMGEYIGRIYIQAKRRPMHIVAGTTEHLTPRNHVRADAPHEIPRAMVESTEKRAASNVDPLTAREAPSNA